MKKLLLAAVALPSIALAAEPDIAKLRDAALKDDVAWEITEGLTTEVGQRAAGTAAEARARDWAVSKLRALGFSNVRVETFDMPVWVRGQESAEILGPYPQKLVVAALGNSGSTSPEGITAEVIGFDSVADLEAASDADIRGKIVFIDHAMPRTQDGSSYGQFGAARRQGPSAASRKGAAGIVIRSIGTDYHRNPHTGVQSWAAGVSPIPAGALTLPDAERLKRILKRGKPVTMRLTLVSSNTKGQSGNVFAEIPGTDGNAGIVLAGCHLDSWDLATGAIDDASGCGIVAAAAKLAAEAGRPRRTIRVVWFGAEEVGLFGGLNYLNTHGSERHAMIAESDFGADRVWRFDSKAPASAKPAIDRIAAALAPLGIVQGRTDGASGSDIGPLSASGVSTIELQQDGTHYFDLHHTPDDTLDKVDREALRQNVAAWTTMLAIAANAREELATPPAAPAQ